MNQYTYNVPFTATHLYSDYVLNRMSQAEIAVKYGTTQKVVWNAMRKLGIKTRIAAKRNQVGVANDNWKGGRTLVAKSGKFTRFSDAGYWYVRDPEHPNAKKSGYVGEHIKVATAATGKSLLPNECVHHIDLCKQNNAASNLEVCTRKRHREYHLQLELISVELYRKGLVEFIPDEGYRLK